MIYIVSFYGIILALVIAVCFFLFRRLRRWGLAFALASSLLVLILSGLMWPIPIHGGFLFFGQVMYNEWSRERESVLQKKQHVSYVRETLKPRFAGILPFKNYAALPNGWIEVVVDSGNTALLDTHTGLIWSDWSLLESSQQRPTLTMAKAHCANNKPQGYWALATTAEQALMWQRGGHVLMPESPTSWMSYSTNAKFKLELPSFHLRSPGSNQVPRTGYEAFSVRCVARSPTAPEWGFTQEDIDLELWNAYQLRAHR